MAVLLAVIASVLTIGHLREGMERGREAQLVAERVGHATTGLTTLALLKASESATDGLIRPLEDTSRDDLAEGLDRLDELLPNQTATSRLRDAANEYVSRLDAAGSRVMTDLRTPERSLPYVAWFELDNALTEVDRVAAERASSAHKAADVGTWITVIVLVLAVFLLASRVTVERARSARLGVEANTDPLTGLANRRAFYEAIEQSLARENQDRTPVSLLMLDLDYFKNVNDTLGHQAGDTVLVEVARRLQSSVRSGDVLARMGGDEFAWILHRCPREAANMVAERALSTLHGEPIDGVGDISACVGVATSADHDDVDGLLKAADTSLYRAKQSGRGRVGLTDEVLTPV